MTKIYTYAKCSTCIKAVKFLESKKIKFNQVPIVETPPSLKELKAMLRFVEARAGTIKNLFNTSGEQYRGLKISDQLKSGMSEAAALKLLSENGKLIKRPFLLVVEAPAYRDGTVGFDSVLWAELLG